VKERPSRLPELPTLAGLTQQLAQARLENSIFVRTGSAPAAMAIATFQRRVVLVCFGVVNSPTSRC
jgi:hypothetical protein